MGTRYLSAPRSPGIPYTPASARTAQTQISLGLLHTMTSYSLLDPLLGLDRCTLLTTFYDSPTAGEVISQDIDQLRKSIDAINGLFDKVMRPLQAFDYEYSISSEAQDALAPQWAAFRTVSPIYSMLTLRFAYAKPRCMLQRFNMCVDSSRDSAAAASRIMHCIYFPICSHVFLITRSFYSVCRCGLGQGRGCQV